MSFEADLRGNYAVVRHRLHKPTKFAQKPEPVVFPPFPDFERPEPKLPSPPPEKRETLMEYWIRKHNEGANRGAPTVKRIIKSVAEFYDVRPEDIVSARRTQDLMIPRQVAMYFAKRMTGLSLPSIGRRFNKDHTTILYALDKIAAKRGRDLEFDLQLSKLAEKLEAENGAWIKPPAPEADAIVA